MWNRTLAALTALVLLLPAAAHAGGCTASALDGRWGFLSTGQVLDDLGNPVAYAAGGVLTLGVGGSLTMTGTQTINGAVSSFTPTSGTWTLDGDCRGTALQGGQPLFKFTVDGATPQIEFIRTDLGYIVTGKAKPMASQCSLTNVRGSYGYAFNAIVYNITLPGSPPVSFPQAYFAGSGVVAIDTGSGGIGHATLDDTASFGGFVIPRHYDGTVQVDPDCTGEAVVTLPPNAPTNANPVHIDAFWVDNRRSVFLIQTDPDTFIAGEATQLTGVPRP